MIFKISKRIISAITVAVLLLVGIAFLLYETCTSSAIIYETPWGRVSLDTARVAMIDCYASRTPLTSYLIHTEVIQKSDSMLKVSVGDTVWYCLTPPGVKYYMVKVDETNKFQVWEWCKYNNVSWPNVTKYFKQEQIFVR